jgi:hypothetical protein
MPPKWFTQKARSQSQSDVVASGSTAKRAKDSTGHPEYHVISAPFVQDVAMEISKDVAMRSSNPVEQKSPYVAMVARGGLEGGSDEAVVDALNAVVAFGDADGTITGITPQASDVAYLVADGVFWRLFRRLAAEIWALQSNAGGIDDATWEGAPTETEAITRFAEDRGYTLSGDVTAPKCDPTWRRSLLTEVASDLMVMRLRMGRGLSLPALAGPPLAETHNHEAEGSLTEKAAAPFPSGTYNASKLIQDIESAVCHAQYDAHTSLVDRLSTVVHAVNFQRERWLQNFGRVHSFVLKGGWSQQRENDIDLVSLALQAEYKLRRHILLRRLDVTVQALCSGEKTNVADTWRQACEVLSNMWVGWRKPGNEAPPVSKWSVLSVRCSTFHQTLEASVCGPGTRLSSNVKSFRMTSQVPYRGGIPDNYQEKTSSALWLPGSTVAASPQALSRMKSNGSAAVASASSSGGHHPHANAIRAAPQSWYTLRSKRSKFS